MVDSTLFRDVRTWNNPAATVVVHAVFAMALWFHHLLLPSLLLSVTLVTLCNYRKRPTYPSRLDLSISGVDAASPDEIDEEFDMDPATSRDPEVVAARYDRLRTMAGRAQVITGDLASRGEQVRALLTWKDPRATAIFELFALLAAIVLWFLPLKVLVAVAWLYMMRPPFLRCKSPSFLLNFLRRLPSEAEALL
ncbi:unnamed protein product [Urochloa humidicola]